MSDMQALHMLWRCDKFASLGISHITPNDILLSPVCCQQLVSTAVQVHSCRAVCLTLAWLRL